MTENEEFQPRGNMSIKDACLQIFRGLEPGAWISRDDLIYGAKELTQSEFDPESIHGIAWNAIETMSKNREIGVKNMMGGYKRLDPIGQVEAVQDRVKRVRRGLRRVSNWTNAALANPKLPLEQRHQMQAIAAVTARRQELEERRAKKQRPIPPSER